MVPQRRLDNGKLADLFCRFWFWDALSISLYLCPVSWIDVHASFLVAIFFGFMRVDIHLSCYPQQPCPFGLDKVFEPVASTQKGLMWPQKKGASNWIFGWELLANHAVIIARGTSNHALLFQCLHSWEMASNKIFGSHFSRASSHAGYAHQQIQPITSPCGLAANGMWPSNPT